MGGRPPKRMTGKVKALLAAYVGEARLNLTEAGRLAGYSKPAQQARQVRAKWPEEFERAEAEFRQRLEVTDQELNEIISNLARNPKHKDHFKAVELLCRLKGKLSEKVHVTLDRATLNSQLDELIALMVQSRATIVGVHTIGAPTIGAPTNLTVEGALPLLDDPADN